MGSEQNRFILQQQPPASWLKRWGGGCLGGLSCFRKQKGGKRIVPASRMSESNVLSNQPNGSQASGLPNQTTGIALSLLAPPSSPASFSNSVLPSTAQSPNCFLSANSPGGLSSTLFVTGPYAHEPQLVSPPVFSTFTTEPSTPPLTPPELAHLTTPSSPDVPYARFLSSSSNLKSTDKSSYHTTTYSLYPGSPASTLRSPVSGTSGDCLSSVYRERDFPPRWDPSIPSQETAYAETDSGRFLGPEIAGVSKSRQDSNFFCPETFAQFYVDQSSFPHSGGRLSVSRESDVYSNGGNGHQNRQSKTGKPDPEELEAYRASFGFSADEIITTPHYVEITDVLEDPFSITPLTSNKSVGEHGSSATAKGAEMEKIQDFPSPQSARAQHRAEVVGSGVPYSYNNFEDIFNVSDQVQKQKRFGDASERSFLGYQIMSDDEDIFSRMGSCRSWKYSLGSSNSDTEIEYRRGRSLREGHLIRMQRLSTGEDET